MKQNKKATSIVEVLVVLVIVTLWVLSSFKLFWSWQKLSLNIQNKIQAIEIAREWIEVVTNIRNTNWFLYSSDYESCWNTLNYNEDCIWDNHSHSNYYINSGSYIVYSNWIKWFLEKKSTSGDYRDSNYRNTYRIYKTWSWFYTQTWVLNTTKFEFKPIFTREIQISYPWWTSFSGSQMLIKSKVFWSDSSSTKPHKVVLQTILTPYKK